MPRFPDWEQVTAMERHVEDIGEIHFSRREIIETRSFMSTVKVGTQFYPIDRRCKIILRAFQIKVKDMKIQSCKDVEKWFKKHIERMIFILNRLILKQNK